MYLCSPSPQDGVGGIGGKVRPSLVRQSCLTRRSTCDGRHSGTAALRTGVAKRRGVHRQKARAANGRCWIPGGFLLSALERSERASAHASQLRRAPLEGRLAPAAPPGRATEVARGSGQGVGVPIETPLKQEPI